MNENNMRDDEGSAAGGVCEIVLLAFSVILIILTFPISIFFCIRIVQEYERAVIFRLGRIKKVILCIFEKSPKKINQIEYIRTLLVSDVSKHIFQIIPILDQN